jgi:3-(3-hydroxy-phenyl)propionate hydroxylase
VQAAGESAWLLQHLGQQFTGVLFSGDEGIDAAAETALKALRTSTIPLKLVVIARSETPPAAIADAKILRDTEGLASARYDARPGTFYLIRPDQHVCARWRQLEPLDVEHALKRALCVQGTA